MCNVPIIIHLPTYIHYIYTIHIFDKVRHFLSFLNTKTNFVRLFIKSLKCKIKIVKILMVTWNYILSILDETKRIKIFSISWNTAPFFQFFHLNLRSIFIIKISTQLPSGTKLLNWTSLNFCLIFFWNDKHIDRYSTDCWWCNFNRLIITTNRNLSVS